MGMEGLSYWGASLVSDAVDGFDQPSRVKGLVR